jgi:hypothetical protein
MLRSLRLIVLRGDYERLGFVVEIETMHSPPFDFIAEKVRYSLIGSPSPLLAERAWTNR